MARREVAVIGPGRVGTALALALVRGGDRVVAAADADGGSAAALAERIAGCRVAPDPAQAVAEADTVLVTVPDDAIEEVVTALAVTDAWTARHHVVHCSGVRGLDPLRRASLAGARVAACHPAQTVPVGADADTLLGASWAVTAAESDRAWAHDLVVAAGGDPFDLREEDRALYHAALTLGSNAVGAALAVARQLLLGARVPAPDRVLRPLVEASVTNVLTHGASALTGPVVRGDVGTVQRHLAALDLDVPELAAAYRALQRVVLEQATRAGAGFDRAALAAVLDGTERSWSE